MLHLTQQIWVSSPNTANTCWRNLNFHIRVCAPKTLNKAQLQHKSRLWTDGCFTLKFIFQEFAVHFPWIFERVISWYYDVNPSVIYQSFHLTCQTLWILLASCWPVFVNIAWWISSHCRDLLSPELPVVVLELSYFKATRFIDLQNKLGWKTLWVISSKLLRNVSIFPSHLLTRLLARILLIETFFFHLKMLVCQIWNFPI